MISTLFYINCWLALCPGFHSFTRTFQTDTLENEILQFVNEDRKQHNLKLLQMNSLESSLALKHSGDMATGKVKFGHDGLIPELKPFKKN